jgi:hypothetical protein
MEQLKNLGQLCRQHYEKLILALVMLLLAGAVYFIYTASQKEVLDVGNLPEKFKKGGGKPPAAPVLTNVLAALDRSTNATNRLSLELSGSHNLLNPVKWVRPVGGGEPVKDVDGSVGVRSMQIKGITPLQVTIAYTRAGSAEVNGTVEVHGYQTMLTNDLEKHPRRRRKAQFIRRVVSDSGAVTFSTNKLFFDLTAVKGPAAAPTELTAKLKDSDELVTFAPGKPFTRVVGYEASLVYPLSKRQYSRLRKGSSVDLEGESYKVVDISPGKVVLSDESNGKRYSIEQLASQEQ